MKKLLFLGILFLIGLLSKAQKVYFIYLQSDNAIPFYVKMGDKIHSSSTAGYLILSNLKDSVYTLSIGLSGKQQSEPKFKVSISNGDRGFLIKELDQKLSLFDFHSLEVVAPIAIVDLKNEDYVTRTDNFTKTLSQAANDPTLLMEAVKKEQVKQVIKPTTSIKEDRAVAIDVKAPIEESAGNDSVNTASTTSLKVQEVKDSISVVSASVSVDTVKTDLVQTGVGKVDDGIKEDVKNGDKENANKEEDVKPVTSTKEEVKNTIEAEYKRTIVVRRSESSTSEGFGLTFIDYTTEGNDTVRLLIPNPKVGFKVAASNTEATRAVEDLSSAPRVIDTSDNIVVKKENCEVRASDADFRRIRKEMAAQDADDEMINKAKDAFKSKCFTTEQIKNLSALFLTSESKYLFFETAFNHTIDPENFESLESELKDEHYSNLFKRLIAK